MNFEVLVDKTSIIMYTFNVYSIGGKNDQKNSIIFSGRPF